MSTEDGQPANVVYYCETGLGNWVGRFDYALTSWSRFQADRIGFRNRILALGLSGFFSLAGWVPIASRLEAESRSPDAIVVANRVRISWLGITLYLLRERYHLASNGREVRVEAHERFGPIPFLFNHRKTHPAEVLDSGKRAIYYIPLLGTQWTAVYTVSPGGRHIDSTLSCAWAVGHERIDKQAPES